MNKVFIIGAGPGAREYLLPVALKRIMDADCLIGATRNMSEFDDLCKEKIIIKGNLDGIISYIKEHRGEKKIAVLVSGDPGLYSFLERISCELDKNDYEVIPGISAMQVAFARIGESWQDATIISLHGRRDGDLAETAKRAGKLFLFTDASLPPDMIAKELISKGAPNKRAVVFERLSYPDEKITDTDLKSLSAMSGFGLCVMIITEQSTNK